MAQSHRIAREEIFGPVLSVLTFRTPAEAVEKANNTPYGLSAGIWTEKGSRILWMADQLRAGVIWANTFNRFDPASPFGGYKESGYGREGGLLGLEAYLTCDHGRRRAGRTTRGQPSPVPGPDRTGCHRAPACRKTYKLFIGGKFPRSESGRSYTVTSPKGDFLANASRASRKDARDAVTAARKAFPGWSGATAYNRGQILYRIAEMLEGRRGQFAEELGTGKKAALEAVDATIDRLVWYAGWSDKIASVHGTANPVAGPYFNLSSPEPTGVVASWRPPTRCWG